MRKKKIGRIRNDSIKRKLLIESVAIQRGNAASVLGNFCVNSCMTVVVFGFVLYTLL